MGVALSWDCGDAHKRPHSRGAIFVRTRVMRQAKPKPSPQSRPSSDQSGCGSSRIASRSGTAHERTNGKKEKEAERRQAQVSQPLHRKAQRAPGAGRARLSAFHGGSCLGTHASQGAASDQVSRGSHLMLAGVSRRRPPRLQRAPRRPVVLPADMMSEPPECAGDEPSARGHRNPLRRPESPAAVLSSKRDKALLVRRAVRVQEIPLAARHLLDPTRYFFALYLIRRHRNCGNAAMIRTFAANPRASSGFFQFYSLYIVISSAGGEQIGRYELTWIERSESRPAQHVTFAICKTRLFDFQFPPSSIFHRS